MKTILGKPLLHMAVLALCSITLSAVPMFAQDSPATQQEQGGRGHRQERRLEMLTQKLNLTPGQVDQVRAIQEETRKQSMAVHQDTAIAEPDQRSKIMQIRKDSQARIRAVLNDDQKTQYDTMLAQMQEHRHDRQGGQDAEPPAPPQQ